MTNPEPRIPLLGVHDAKAAAAEAGVSELVAELNVFRVWLHHPKLARWMNDMLMGLLWDGRLDARLRSLPLRRPPARDRRPRRGRGPAAPPGRRGRGTRPRPRRGHPLRLG